MNRECSHDIHRPGIKLVSRLAKSCLALGLTLLLAPTLTFAQHYVQTNLVADATTTVTPPAPVIDPNLKNPWGLTRSTSSPWWIGDNNAGVSTLYDVYVNSSATPAGAQAVTIAKVVTVPGPMGSPAGFVSAPTGVVFNGVSAAFGGKTFIFVTEDGTISGYPGVPTTNLANLEVDNSVNPSAKDGAVYKGATIAEFRGNLYLYVTNFRSGQIEVYDTNFQPVTFFDDADDHDHDGDRFDDWRGNRFGDRFEDDQIPRGFAPFNVQNIGNSLLVTYAKQDKAKHDDVAGDGFGYVDIYSPSGRLEARLEHGPWFNSPWGAVWAPRDFGAFSNRVLIGNFGSGKIAVFDGFDGKFIGFMEDDTTPGNVSPHRRSLVSNLWQ